MVDVGDDHLFGNPSISLTGAVKQLKLSLTTVTLENLFFS